MDRQTLFRNLALGFLPLLIFIIADEIFELFISLAIALGVSVIQLVVIYLREKRFDKFTLLDAGLIGALGIVSLVFDNPVFILFKPAIIESIFVILIGVTLFTKNPVLIQMSQRYMGGMELGDQQLYLMRRMLHVMFWLFLIHIALVAASALYVGEPDSAGYLKRKEIWAFISGGLLYILIGISFAFQFIKSKINQRKFMRQYADDEWFDIVTPKGKVVGRAPRTLCHGNPNLLHPVVHVHVFNSNGDLWLQKRSSDKKIQPGKWDTSVGGHISSGERMQDALQREIKEELGITRLAHEPLYQYVMRNEIESELVYTFRGIHNGPFAWPSDEIETGRFWPIQEIKNKLGSGVFTPNFEQEFKLMQKIKVV